MIIILNLFHILKDQKVWAGIVVVIVKKQKDIKNLLRNTDKDWPFTWKLNCMSIKKASKTTTWMEKTMYQQWPKKNYNPLTDSLNLKSPFHSTRWTSMDTYSTSTKQSRSMVKCIRSRLHIKLSILISWHSTVLLKPLANTNPGTTLRMKTAIW